MLADLIARAKKLRNGNKHMQAVRELACVVCRNEGLGDTPASAHHINDHAAGAKSSDWEVIGLCPPHHQHADGTAKFGGHIAVHKSLTEFEARYGTEEELLLQTLTELGV